MTKSYTPEFLETLAGYSEDPKDHEILVAVSVHGGIRQAAEATGLARRTMQRRLGALKEHAVTHGFNPQYPEASTQMDLNIFGKTRLIKHDPPLPDGTILEWVKAKKEDYTAAKMAEYLCSGIVAKPRKPRKVSKAKKKYIDSELPILTLADLHLGMLASGIETDDEWDLDKNLAMVTALVDRLIDDMKFYEKGVFVELGDLTHTDGLIAKTPRSGHPLDVSHRYFDVCRAAAQLMVYIIDRLLEKVKVLGVFLIRGNHDDISSWHLNEKLIALYKDEPRVEFNWNDAYHQMFEWGKCMVVMTHGEAANNRQQYEWITTMWPKQFGRAKYVYVMQGHIHHTDVKDIGNVRFESFNTVSKSDAYHYHKMYKSLRSMSVVFLDKAGAPAGRLEKCPR